MENENKHIDYTELISKYLTNEASSEEIALLEKWVVKDKANKQLFNNYKQTWILSRAGQSDDKVDIDEEWNKIRLKLFGDETEKIETGQNEKQRKIIPFVLKIAAVIVIALTASYFLYYLITKSGTETFVAQDSIKTSTLSDGTIITLNFHSTITFPKKFDKKARKVKLEGDAFFEVEHNNEQPFIIKTQDVKIEVLGTSFYVNSRQQDPTIEVVVNTGKVALRTQNNEQIILTAGERGVLIKSSGELYEEKNDDVNYISWKTKRLVFENNVLSDVIQKINETYYADIKIVNPEINSCRITTTFDNKSLDAVLNIIRETLDLKIEKQNNTIFVSGEGCE